METYSGINSSSYFILIDLDFRAKPLRSNRVSKRSQDFITVDIGMEE